MKKFIFFLVVITLFATIISNKSLVLNAPINVKTEQSQLGDYQKEIDRANELKKKMENPVIVQTALRKVRKITTLEGNYRYGSVITDKGFMDLTLREMTLDLKFKFGIGMDLEHVKVMKVEGTTVFLKIPKNWVQLQYIQLNPDSKIINGKKMILVSQFNPSDVETLIEQSQQKVVNSIGANKNLFDTANINLQNELEKLVLSLGYYQQVIFDVI